MTEKQVLKLVGHWQEFLGLSHWNLMVDFEDEAGDGAEARIWRYYTYDTAVLYLDSEWKTWDAVRANEILAHELIHLVTRDLERAWDSVEDQVDPAVFRALDSRFNHELEGVIDRLALKFVELANS